MEHTDGYGAPDDNDLKEIDSVPDDFFDHSFNSGVPEDVSHPSVLVPHTGESAVGTDHDGGTCPDSLHESAGAVIPDWSELLDSLSTQEQPAEFRDNFAISENNMKDVMFQALRRVFRYESFRNGQEDIIRCLLRGEDVFVCMSTGSGKSLLYQLPASVHSSSLTIVFSPLISLMQDQMLSLKSLNIRACLYNSTLSITQKDDVMNTVYEGECNVLIMTPEATSTKDLMLVLDDLYSRHRILRVVIDECHCICQWGDDFRPIYSNLGDIVRVRWPTVPILALTASTTPKTSLRIISTLRMSSPSIFVGIYNRPNIRYTAIECDSKNRYDLIVHLITNYFPSMSGIVYLHTRRATQNCCKYLNGKKISADFYHAGRLKNDRIEVQERWSLGTVPVICATNSFALGIDKPDVRFVIHCGLPWSLEEFYQESGRAGRDGQPSESITLIDPGKDIYSMCRIVDEYGAAVEVDSFLVDSIILFTNNNDCRREKLLAFFSENVHSVCSYGSSISECDTCRLKDKYVYTDVTCDAKNFVDLIRVLEDNDFCIDLLDCLTAFSKKKCKKPELPEFIRSRRLQLCSAENLPIADSIIFHLLGTRHIKTSLHMQESRGSYVRVSLGPAWRLVNESGFKYQIKARSDSGECVSKKMFGAQELADFYFGC